MKKHIRTVTFFALSILIGLATCIVAKNTNSTYLYVSAKSLQELAVSIEAEKESIQKLRLLTAESQIKLKDYRESLRDPDNTILEQTIEKELETAKMAAGAIDLKGQGIIATLDDGIRPLYNGENPNDILVHDFDILTIINDLNMAGAEAISINGQRLTSTSEILCSGYTVKVNNIFIARPFIIKAIGDPKILKSTLVAPGQIGDYLKAYGLIFYVEESENVLINGYGMNQNYKYMELVKEGDLQ